MPALVTLCVRRARRMVGSRTMHGMKRAAHRAARRLEHANTRAAALHIDPDVPNHPAADARLAGDRSSTRCTSMSAEWDGRPIRCVYEQGHAVSHCDGCVTWENNDPPLSQRDEPRHREPRRLTSWDVV